MWCVDVSSRNARWPLVWYFGPLWWLLGVMPLAVKYVMPAPSTSSRWDWFSCRHLLDALWSSRRTPLASRRRCGRGPALCTTLSAGNEMRPRCAERDDLGAGDAPCSRRSSRRCRRGACGPGAAGDSGPGAMPYAFAAPVHERGPARGTPARFWTREVSCCPERGWFEQTRSTLQRWEAEPQFCPVVVLQWNDAGDWTGSQPRRPTNGARLAWAVSSSDMQTRLLAPWPVLNPRGRCARSRPDRLSAIEHCRWELAPAISRLPSCSTSTAIWVITRPGAGVQHLDRRPG